MDTIYTYPHPYVCTDATVFTLKTQDTTSYRKLPKTKLAILLYRRVEEPFKGKWCLPGGFLNIDELPEEAIQRKLLEKANLSKCYLEQLYTFCAPDRDPRARIISITYLGLMSENEGLKMPPEQWFEITSTNGQLQFSNHQMNISELDFGFDHYHIINIALERLRSKLVYSNIVHHLMPEYFTLTQLQSVYETILDKKETAANFRRKTADLVQETELYTKDMGHRPAKLFTKRS